MAGRRHHHVWQLLQRGFGEKLGKDHHVWVYRKGKPCKRTATRLFGVENHFYGEEGSEADSVITEYENDSQSVIQDLRKLPSGEIVDREFAAILISHLEMRSEFLRKEASTEMQNAVGGLMKKFQSPTTLRNMMLEYLKENPDELDKWLGKSFIPPSHRQNFSKLFEDVVAAMTDDEIMNSMGSGLEHLSAITNEFPNITKRGQNKALVLSATNSERAEIHMGRKYSLLRFQKGSFILPDTTLAFVEKSGASPFSQKGNEVEAVIIPISAEVAIVGSNSGKTEFSLKTINRLLAGCSFQAFLGKENSPEFQRLSSRIGKYAKLLKGQSVQI